MRNPTEVRNAIDRATTVQEFQDADALLRGEENAPHYEDLLGRLNAKSAPAMFKLKAEIDGSGQAMQFAREIVILRAAGYPGGQELAGWRRRVLIGDARNTDTLWDELFEDDGLDAEQHDAVIRLIEAARNPRLDGLTEANWTDVALSPTAQRALARLDRKTAEIANHQGDELYTYLLDQIESADTASALKVLGNEARAQGRTEAELLRQAVEMRAAELAGHALAQIVNEYGWPAVRAIYQNGDMTRSLSDSELVGEFMGLMAQVQGAVAQIRSVDSKLGERVMKETWTRSGERMGARKRMEETRRRIEEAVNDA